jgi:hypothetical protein
MYVDGGALPIPIVVSHALTFPATDAAPDIVAGQAPNAEHPRGTVFFLGTESGHPVATISEWDLATSVRLRQVDLPAPFRTYRMASTGRRLFVAAVDGLDTVHGIQLTPALHIEANESFGKGELVAMAADEALAAIAWLPLPGPALRPADTTFIRILDASGKTLGAAASGGELHSMAVVGTNVYLVAETFPPLWGKPGSRAEPSERLEVLDSGGRQRGGVWFSRVDFHRVYAHGGGIVLVDPVAAKAEVRGLRDLKPTGDLGFPYFEGPVDPSGWDATFDLAASPSGRLVSTRADVLDADFSTIQRRFAVGPLAVKALWIAEEAAVLDSRTPQIPAQLRWLDP